MQSKETKLVKESGSLYQKTLKEGLILGLAIPKVRRTTRLMRWNDFNT